MADTSSPSSSDSAAPPSKVGGKEFLPSDTVTNRFKNFYRMAVGSMSLEGQKKYWEDADERYSASDCKRCENYRDYLMNYSPIIRYMTENIQRLGGDVNSTNVRCRTCKTGMLGGFDHRYGIMICANWMDSRKMQEDVMAHEMVHAYDQSGSSDGFEAGGLFGSEFCSYGSRSGRGKTDEMRQQIRASNLSGECRWANEFFKNKIMAFTNHQQDCVRRRAVHSVKNRPNCPDEATATRVVDQVWHSCFRDTRPFDEIYR
jgi:mitochondrial inner membrane protease ATP23